MLDAKNITYRVGNRELISNADVSFEQGRLHLVIGPNGAGKSTLIKILAGVVRPQAGSVEYRGVDAAKIAESELARHRAVLSQAIEVAFPLSVREIVMMGRYPHFQGRPGSDDVRIVDELMELFGVTEFRDRNYQTLSGGERQRVNFARVLAQLWHGDQSSERENRSETAQAKYLFLDEPLTFLDIRHQIEFMKMIGDFARRPNVVVIGVVHDLNLAARFADRLVLIDGGRVAAAGAPAEVLTADRIRKVFGVEPEFVTTERSGLHLIFD